MRPEVPVIFNSSMGWQAACYGWPRARIELGTELVRGLSKEELLAILAHELGHRNLYHIERRRVAAVLCVIVTAAACWWWGVIGLFAWLPMIAITEASRVMHELEADAYAMRTYLPSVYQAAWEKAHAGCGAKPGWVTRFRRRFITKVVAERG